MFQKIKLLFRGLMKLIEKEMKIEEYKKIISMIIEERNKQIRLNRDRFYTGLILHITEELERKLEGAAIVETVGERLFMEIQEKGFRQTFNRLYGMYTKFDAPEFKIEGSY